MGLKRTKNFKLSVMTGALILAATAAAALQQLLPVLDAFTRDTVLPQGIVAGVAVGGTVEPTPVNTLYAELQAQQKDLNQRARELDAKEQYLSHQNSNRDHLLTGLIILLLTLVGLNFYFDIKRGRITSRPQVT